MIELDQPDYWYIQEKKIGTKSVESCSLVVSQILAEFRPGRVTLQIKLHN